MIIYLLLSVIAIWLGLVNQWIWEERMRQTDAEEHAQHVRREYEYVRDYEWR